ncbi:3-oxoacyl-ACP synthase III family protein [Chondrinema litorale]|uniref:3-oxoacyl-ACP synthase III family protein n=1 Tax=Chondrinema litorale TaxID=2994555 RepID=UPI00254398F7|nr:beta-ketoacyl-ACP synthase III [Chondrinema litorale]UZR96203.1 ketoacyl-ACP synthase III [Chondrinema litorale]
MKNAKLAGIGYYVPENIVTNDDLSKIMNTSDEWIVERTGIKERRYANVEEDKNYVMGAKAARKAMKMAGTNPEEIDLIVYATLSADYVFPGSGVLLQKELGCKHIGAIDVRAQCSGFVYGLSIAEQYIKTGMYKNVLLVGSEIHSIGLDYTDNGRHIAIIFGDGAGAAVLQPSEEKGKGVLSTHLHSEGEHAEQLAVIDPGFHKKERFHPDMIKPGGGFYPVMNGQFVFKNAVTRFPEVIQEALDKNGYAVSDLDLLIPHQANLRISQFVQKKMGLPDEKIHNTIMKYGNTTAASIPIGLCEAYEAGKVKDGDLVCLAAFGSGFTWASALIRW